MYNTEYAQKFDFVMGYRIAKARIQLNEVDELDVVIFDGQDSLLKHLRDLLTALENSLSESTMMAEKVGQVYAELSEVRYTLWGHIATNQVKTETPAKTNHEKVGQRLYVLCDWLSGKADEAIPLPRLR